MITLSTLLFLTTLYGYYKYYKVGWDLNEISILWFVIVIGGTLLCGAEIIILGLKYLP